MIRTDPPGGQAVSQGSKVTLFVSDGPERIPDVTGLSQGEAEQQIRDAGFVPQVREESNTTEPKGTVIDQFPGADTTANQGATVLIIVSTFEPEPEPDPSESPSDEPSEEPTPTPPTPSPPGERVAPSVAARVTPPADARRSGSVPRRTPVR